MQTVDGMMWRLYRVHVVMLMHWVMGGMDTVGIILVLCFVIKIGDLKRANILRLRCRVSRGMDTVDTGYAVQG